MSLLIPPNDYFLVKPGFMQPSYLSKNPRNAILYLHDHEKMSSFLSQQDQRLFMQKNFPDIPFVVHGGGEASVYVKYGDAILEANINRIYSAERRAKFRSR